MEATTSDLLTAPKHPGNRISRRHRFLRLFFEERFTREMGLRARIDRIHEEACLGKEEHRTSVALKYAVLAVEALRHREFEHAWRNVLSGERLLLEAQTDDQLAARASALTAEALGTLPVEESKSVSDILDKAKNQAEHRTQEWRDTIIEAQMFYDNRIIHQNDMRERTAGRVTTLMIMIIVFLGMLVTLLWWQHNSDPKHDLLSLLFSEERLSDDNKNPISIQMTMPLLLSTLLLGAIGACLSALLSFASLGRSPGMYEGLWVTAARPVVGAVSGMVAIMLVRSSLVDFKNVAAIGVVAFAFGFSERLVMGAVERLESIQKG